MMNINTLLMTDFYKTCHMNMYSDKIAKMTSYLTPRSSRIPGLGWVVFMGLTDFCQTYLIEGMNNTFFNVDFEIIKEQYYDVLGKSLGYPKKDIDKTVEKVKALHELRYLPIQIKAVPEGTRVPMSCPCIEIRVTDGRFP
jgi:nicotinamide phosphoribosyltransferase